MSEEEQDLELMALERRLDDAYATTRPRLGFEDELWARMQSQRPAPNRLRDAFAGLWQGIRDVPAVPAAAVATLLVVVIGGGVLFYGLSHIQGGSQGSTSALSTGAGLPRNGDQLSAGGFGVLPSPVFSQSFRGATAPSVSSSSGAEYAGPALIVWAGVAAFALAGAPVFRYREPSTKTADQFATALGTVLRGRPDGFLGSYASADYTLKVRGTVQSPPSSPAYFIFASASMQEIQAAGASPADLANIFLAEHSLLPQWTYTVRTDKTGDPIKVVYERQFDVPGFGPAHLVDSTGSTYGLEVDLSNNRPVIASGTLPVNLEGAYYDLASPAQAILPALAPSSTGTLSPPPTIQMTQVDLVYALVPAGDHSFYEPAYLYSGTLKLNGVTYMKHLLEPAVVQSQRSQ